VKSITFTKVTDHRGTLPLDATFVWTYTTAGPDQAPTRARKAFEAAIRLDPKYQNEDLRDWKVAT
jgi:hypothetical protein